MSLMSSSLCSRSESWSLCCVRQVTRPRSCGPPRVTPAALPSASRTCSTEMGRSPTAPPSTHQTCSAWRSTDTRTARFVKHITGRLLVQGWLLIAHIQLPTPENERLCTISQVHGRAVFCQKKDEVCSKAERKYTLWRWCFCCSHR